MKTVKIIDVIYEDFDQIPAFTTKRKTGIVIRQRNSEQIAYLAKINLNLLTATEHSFASKIIVRRVVIVGFISQRKITVEAQFHIYSLVWDELHRLCTELKNANEVV